MTQSFGVIQGFYCMQPNVLSCFPKKIGRTEEGWGGGGELSFSKRKSPGNEAALYAGRKYTKHLLALGERCGGVCIDYNK